MCGHLYIPADSTVREHHQEYIQECAALIDRKAAVYASDACDHGRSCTPYAGEFNDIDDWSGVVACSGSRIGRMAEFIFTA